MKKVLLMITIFLMAGCSVIPSLSQPIEITDATGHTETLDGIPDRIAIAGKATIMVQDAIFMFADAREKVIALENRSQSAFSFLPLIDPGLEEKEIFEKKGRQANRLPVAKSKKLNGLKPLGFRNLDRVLSQEYTSTSR